MTVKLFTDSTSSIPESWRKEHDITVIGLSVIEDGRALPDKELDPETYYDHVASLPEIPTTSQPSVEAFANAFTETIEAGDEVLCVLISEKMSGAMQAARLAAERVRKTHPNARIELVDSETNSLQEGMAVLNAARLAGEGGTMDECVAKVRETMLRTRFLFVPKGLENLRKGGRIGNASALLGNLLKLRPILSVEEGMTTTVAKVRTDTKAGATLFDVFKNDVGTCGLRQAYVHYIGPKEPTEQFARTYVEPFLGRMPELIPVSAVIGIHVGPTIASVVYECEEPLR